MFFTSLVVTRGDMNDESFRSAQNGWKLRKRPQQQFPQRQTDEIRAVPCNTRTGTQNEGGAESRSNSQ